MLQEKKSPECLDENTPHTQPHTWHFGRRLLSRQAGRGRILEGSQSSREMGVRRVFHEQAGRA